MRTSLPRRSGLLVALLLAASWLPWCTSDDTIDGDNEMLEDFLGDNYFDHYHHFHYGDDYYGHDYFTHGSLLIDDVENLEEFLDMDATESAVIGLFDHSTIAAYESHEETAGAPPPPSPALLFVWLHDFLAWWNRSHRRGRTTLDGDHQQLRNFAVYRELADEYSHMLRFGHSTSEQVRQHLKISGSAVLLFPAVRFQNSEAVSRKRYPSKSLYKDSLLHFLLMESAPLVATYDWKATDRAKAVDHAMLILFGKIDEPVHGAFHWEDPTDAHVEEKLGDGGDEAWPYDMFADALKPVGQLFPQDIDVLVADRRIHSYDLNGMGLASMRDTKNTFGVVLRYGDEFSALTFTWPDDMLNDELVGNVVSAMSTMAGDYHRSSVTFNPINHEF